MEQQTGHENIQNKLVERVDMPAEVASEVAEDLASGFSTESWQLTLIRVDEKYGKFGDRTNDPNVMTKQGEVLAGELSELQTSEVFMDAVIDMVNKLQKDSGKMDWGSWKEHVGRGVLIARDVVVRTISEGKHKNSFTTDEEVGKVEQDPEGILKLVGLAMEDAGDASTENYENMFDNPTHPAIVEIAKRRGRLKEINVVNPKSVVEDLGLRQGYGRTAK